MESGLKLHIWVGIPFQDGILYEKLPTNVAENLEESSKYEAKGIVFEDFFVNHARIGIGMEVPRWTFREVGLECVVRRVNDTFIPRVAEVLKSWGINEEPRLYTATDPSGTAPVRIVACNPVSLGIVTEYNLANKKDVQLLADTLRKHDFIDQ